MSKKLIFHSVSDIVSFQSNCHTLIARATELDAVLVRLSSRYGLGRLTSQEHRHLVYLLLRR